MFGFKNFLIVGLSVLAIALVGLYWKKGESLESRWIEVVFKESQDPLDALNLERDYSEFWEERPNGIGALKMYVKLLPNIDTSKNSFLLGYKAEMALNSQAENLKEIENENEFNFSTGQYEVRFWFSLLDEDGFCLESVYTHSKGLSFIYTDNFLNLIPGGDIQTEQVIITSEELSPQLAARIKKVRVDPRLKKINQ